jgi:AcrR family transcriptional regulator
MPDSPPNDPARHLTRKGQATRDRIVDAAAALMIERGVAATSTEDVQRTAGVSPSQLYHYFGDKRTLVRAVIEHATRAVLDAQQPLLGRLDTLDALRAWRDLLVDLQARRQCRGGCPLGTLASELCETWPDTRDDLADGFARWREPIRAGLRAMHARGELRPGADPDTLALALLAALQGGLLLTKVQRDTAPLEAALDTMIDQIASTCSAAPDDALRRS